MTSAGFPTSTRHATRSREAILKAATELFAEHGYVATTLEAVGARAGLSRGTPAYFYGSKPRLYEAVLTHGFTQAREALLQARREARQRGLAGQDAFRHDVESYVAFLVEHPDFVRLVEWEALGHGIRLQHAKPHLETVMAALEDIGEVFAQQLPPGYDLSQLLLSIAGLCWFPIAHRETLGRVLGLDPLDRAFIDSRTQHVVELVLHGVGGVPPAKED